MISIAIAKVLGSLCIVAWVGFVMAITSGYIGPKDNHLGHHHG